MKNLKACMLIEIDILASEEISLNLTEKKATIESCDNIEISLMITMRSINQINWSVYVNWWTVISSQSHETVLISVLNLSKDQNLLFKPDCQHGDVAVYAHIVNHTLMKIHIWNDMNLSLTVACKTKMSRLIEYKTDDCYLVSSDNTELTSIFFQHSTEWVKQCFQDMLVITVFHISMKADISVNDSTTNISVFRTSS